MALGMRHWVAALVLSVATVTVWLLPPTGLGPGRGSGLENLASRAATASADLRVAHGTLQRIRWADSLPRLAVQTAQGGLATGFPSHEDLRDETRRTFHDLVQREVDALDRRDPTITLGSFYQPFRHAELPGLAQPPRGREGDETYVGRYEGQPYCLRVRVVDGARFVGALERNLVSLEKRLRTNPARSNLLGACRPYARFGLAGPKIQEWLERGAIGFAGDQRLTSQRLAVSWRNRRNVEFWLAEYRGIRGMAVNKCMAGRADACLRLMTDPAHLAGLSDDQKIVDGSPAVSLGGSSSRSPFGGLDDFLFLDLEREFGAEAFQRFWTSEQEVPVAFEQAFGIELGPWTVSWIQRLMGTREAGPGLPGHAIWLSLLTVSFLAGLSGLWHRGRRVA